MFRRRSPESERPDTSGEPPGRHVHRLLDTAGDLRGVRVQRSSTPGDVLGTLIAEPAAEIGTIGPEIDGTVDSPSTFTVWMAVRASAIHDGLASALGEAADQLGRPRSTVVIEVWDLDLDDPDVRTDLTLIVDAGFGVALPLDRPDLGAIAGLDGLPITDVSVDLSALDRLGDLAIGAVRSVQALARAIGLGVLHRRLPESVDPTDLEPSDRVLVVDPTSEPTGSLSVLVRGEPES